MKKILAFVLAAVLLLSLAACGAKNEQAVAVLWSEGDHAVIPNSLINAMDRAMYIENINYTYYGANGDAALQVTQAQQALDAGCPVLLVELVDAASAQSIVDLAKAKSVPVVFFGCEVDASVVSSYDKCYHVNTDESTKAAQLQTMLEGYLKDNAKDLAKKESVRYANLSGYELIFKYEGIQLEEVTVDAAAVVPEDVDLIVTESDAQAFEILLQLQAKDYNTNKLVTNRVVLLTVGNEVDYKGYVLEGAPEGEDARKEHFESNKYLVDLTTVKEEDLAAMIYTTINVVDTGRICGTVMEDFDAIAVAAAKLTANLLTGKGATEGIEHADGNKVNVSYTVYAG